MIRRRDGWDQVEALQVEATVRQVPMAPGESSVHYAGRVAALAGLLGPPAEAYSCGAEGCLTCAAVAAAREPGSDDQ